MTTAEWIERMRPVGVVTVARQLGAKVTEQASAWAIGPCPACGEERRHRKSKDKRGAVSAPKRSPSGWRCNQCEATGDTLHFVALSLTGRKLGEGDADDTARVREWCERFLGGAVTSAGGGYQPTPEDTPAEPSYPPDDDVQALWFETTSVTDDDDVAAFLERGRKINPAHVTARELARALPANAPDLPEWAHFGRRSWAEADYRLLVPLYDAAGAHRSYIARRIRPGGADTPKGISARGFARGGLVMACARALVMLRTGKAPTELHAGRERACVVVTEGEMDFLTWATEPSEIPFAVLGIVEGSWTPAIAERLPSGLELVLALDRDKAGEALARRVARPLTQRLRTREITATRWNPTT